jgi:amylosucrase
MLTVPQQAQAALAYVRQVLSNTKTVSDPSFASRLDRHFVTVFGIFTELYGDRVDALDQLVELIKECAQSWADRPEDLKELDRSREAEPDWFLSNNMLGGVLYVSIYLHISTGTDSLDGPSDVRPAAH